MAGILRERMLFNMSEDEWDAVIAVHLKGHFTIYRHAAAIMRKQESGSLVGFTSGAYAGSIAQANYSAAKGGIVSLTRSAAAGLHRYGVRANASPRSRAPGCLQTCRWSSPTWVSPKTSPRWSSTCCLTPPSTSPARSTRRSGGRIAVWNQPVEVREMTTEGRWTPEEIADRFDSEVGSEKMGLIERVEQTAAAAQATSPTPTGQKPERLRAPCASTTPSR